jgi:mono/diheme cytochrome c family protein
MTRNKISSMSWFASGVGTCLIGAMMSSIVLGKQVAPTAAAAKTTKDGVYSEVQALRGKKLYEAQCGRCHGASLGGIEYSPPLAGSAFMEVWFGQPVDALTAKIQESMPQNAPGTLDRKQSTDIVAYMLKEGGAPAGDHELGDTTEVQTAITIGK